MSTVMCRSGLRLRSAQRSMLSRSTIQDAGAGQQDPPDGVPRTRGRSFLHVSRRTSEQRPGSLYTLFTVHGTALNRLAVCQQWASWHSSACLASATNRRCRSMQAPARRAGAIAGAVPRRARADPTILSSPMCRQMHWAGANAGQTTWRGAGP